MMIFLTIRSLGLGVGLILLYCAWHSFFDYHSLYSQLNYNIKGMIQVLIGSTSVSLSLLPTNAYKSFDKIMSKKG